MKLLAIPAGAMIYFNKTKQARIMADWRGDSDNGIQLELDKAIKVKCKTIFIKYTIPIDRIDASVDTRTMLVEMDWINKVNIESDCLNYIAIPSPDEIIINILDYKC